MTDHVDRVSQLADLQQCLRVAERGLTKIENELISLRGGLVDEREVAEVLADFDRPAPPFSTAVNNQFEFFDHTVFSRLLTFAHYLRAMFPAHS